MQAVLGIDAAWTTHNPSGVALIRTDSNGRWKFVAVAPSYDAFIKLADGNNVQWDMKPKAGAPEPKHLLEAAKKLLGGEKVTVVSVDMPLSYEPITQRRKSDKLISQGFGGKKCGTHSPNEDRPGKISDQLRKCLDGLGYPLAVRRPAKTQENAGVRRETIEVYPHTGLLSLLNLGG